MTDIVVRTIPFLVSAALGAAVFTVVVLPYRGPLNPWNRSELAHDFGFLLFACVLGLTVGLLAGYSREAAIGAVVPAVLTLIGALVGFMCSHQPAMRAPN